METETYKLEKLGQYLGWEYRGAKIARRGTSKGRTRKSIRPYYEVDVTKIATDQYRSRFYSHITKYSFITDTLKEATNIIDKMFADGELS